MCKQGNKNSVGAIGNGESHGQVSLDSDEVQDVSWVNGFPAHTVSIADRGLAYGDGLFETIRVNESPVLFAQHMSRLARGLNALRIPLELSIIEEEIARFLQRRHHGVLKVIVTRGEGGRGYAAPLESQPNRILSWHPLPVYPESYYREGISLYACRTVLSQNPVLAGIKHLNRLEQVIARSEWSGDDFQEGVLCDQQGCVIEAIFSNLWTVKNGGLITPPLKTSGVAGVMREWLLDELPKHGMDIKEACISPLDLLSMDEIFLSNSVFGIWPVKQYKEGRWSPGPITKLSQKLIEGQLF